MGPFSHCGPSVVVSGTSSLERRAAWEHARGRGVQLSLWHQYLMRTSCVTTREFFVSNKYNSDTFQYQRRHVQAKSHMYVFTYFWRHCRSEWIHSFSNPWPWPLRKSPLKDTCHCQISCHCWSPLNFWVHCRHNGVFFESVRITGKRTFFQHLNCCQLKYSRKKNTNQLPQFKHSAPDYSEKPQDFPCLTLTEMYFPLFF